MLAKTREIARAGAAGIDGGRHPGPPAEIFRIDAKRGAAPVDMGVQVDEARGHVCTSDVAHRGARSAFEVRAKRGDLACGEGHIHSAIEILRGVDDVPALEKQIVSHVSPLRCSSFVWSGATAPARSTISR